MTKFYPFRYCKTNPKIMRLPMMTYVRFTFCFAELFVWPLEMDCPYA
jgi:hypothetical protein